MQNDTTIHILYLLDRYPVPSETFILSDMRALYRPGISPHPVALTLLPDSGWHQEAIDSPARPIAAPSRFHPVNDWRQWRRNRLRRRQSAEPAGSPPSTPSSLPSAGIRFPFRERLHLRRTAWLADYADAVGADVIHASFATLPAALAYGVSRETGRPFTVSVHARDVFIDSPRLNETLRAASGIFACNSAVESAARERIQPASNRIDDPPAPLTDTVVSIRHPVPEAFLNSHSTPPGPTGRVGSLSSDGWAKKRGWTGRWRRSSPPHPKARTSF